MSKGLLQASISLHASILKVVTQVVNAPKSTASNSTVNALLKGGFAMKIAFALAATIQQKINNK